VKVSLVCTVKDARPAIEEFLASVGRQTRPPDEIVVVDGGSTDGTSEVLERTDELTLLREPGANIARGRNVAIRAATHDVIAVTDGDCVLASDWLERLLEPIERGADVSAGFYEPIAESLFEVCAASAIPDREELTPDWMPSARSVAFRREAWEAAGAYPEWLDIGEDMYLNHRWVESGARIELAPSAVAYWRMRPTVAETWRQYVRYAEGDAIARMYPRRHAIRFGAYAFLAAALVTRNRWLLGAAAVGSVAYAWKPIRRTWLRLPVGSRDRWTSLGAVPAVMAVTDAAKMWGYANGRRRSRDLTASTAGRRSRPGWPAAPPATGPTTRTRGTSAPAR
jgi:glycosyltransferase involved in cell wall biosynthesis